MTTTALLLFSIVHLVAVVPGQIVAQPFYDGEGPDVNPAMHFNRVEGFRPQLGVQRDIEKIGMIYGKAGYGISRNEWVYDFGFARWAFEENRLVLGAGYHQRVGTNDAWAMGDEEASALDLVTGTSTRDYFLETGYEFLIRKRLSQPQVLELRFCTDDYDDLRKRTDWSVFDRKKTKRQNWERDTDAGRDRFIVSQQINSILITYRLDLSPGENADADRASEAHIQINSESAGGRLSGDATYSRTVVQGRFRLAAGSNDAFAITFFGGRGDTSLPLQKRFELGGIGTLPGYRFKEFGGDRMALLRCEYLFGNDRMKIVPFLGAGTAWDYDREFSADDVKYDAGVGIEIDAGEGQDRFRIEAARPVAEPGRKAWQRNLLFLKEL